MATDLSIETSVIISDSNIEDVISQGGYNDGVKYFMVGKSSVVDYFHSFGQDDNALYTYTSFDDKAGSLLTQSRTITGNTLARFDYTGDIDCYAFTPSSTGTYTITTDKGSGYDIDMVVYDTCGNVIAYDYSAINADLDVYLASGSRYFIKVYDFCDNVSSYVLICFN